jgi:RNA 2',3'-cyclic 3'-phosphodiesterase
MRLFVALDIDEAIQRRLDDYVRTLQPRLPGVRFVRSNTYHVTLKFLGELPTADAVCERLRGIRAPRFEIMVGGIGFFPNARAPRVFWAGIRSGIWAANCAATNSPALPALAHCVDQALEELGFPPEREFHPHLTLARNGSGRPRPRHGLHSVGQHPSGPFAQLFGIVASAPAPEFGTMTAREFFLYESKLSPCGPSYAKLEAFKLAD